MDMTYIKQILKASKLVVVVLTAAVALVLLVSAYSQTPLTLGAGEGQLQRRTLCERQEDLLPDGVQRSIPWELKDERPPGTPLHILKLQRPDYSPDYKNPCWEEQTVTGMRLRCLPYYFLAGFPKCGTTDLWRNLKKHPQVSAPQGKEPHFWTRRQYTKNGTIERYVKRFDKTANAITKNYTNGKERRYSKIVTGDGSASTVWDNIRWRQIPENCNSTDQPAVINAHLIKHLLPKAKIIVILRNPIDRIYSDYLFFNKGKNKSQSQFHRQCVKAVSTMKLCLKQHSVRHCVYGTIRTLTQGSQVRLHVGMYSVYLKDWLNIFPRNQMHFLQMEEYSKDRAKALRDIFNFLSLDPFKDEDEINELPVQNKRRPKARKVGGMLNKTRDILYKFYKPFNEQLRQLLQNPKYNYPKYNSEMH